MATSRSTKIILRSVRCRCVYLACYRTLANIKEVPYGPFFRERMVNRLKSAARIRREVTRLPAHVAALRSKCNLCIGTGKAI